uniref:Uncharacterized protein n=1 Tax=Tanacetum cinerariifolium TaxID=118510 RepID=A0A6L2MJV4_TANCI|nr:hypothetical protein [Tanacetum cinerariifolium]
MDQNTNSSGFDQFQPPQYSSKEISNDELKIMLQSYFVRMNQSREQEELLAEQELRQQEQAAQEKEGLPKLRHSALNSTLLSINLKAQRLNKEKQEVKNIVEHPTKRGTRIIESLQNIRVIHKKSSISLNNTSQISPFNAITPVLPTKEHEYSLSMGYEHLSTTPEMESDEVIESSVKNLIPIPNECEVTFDNKSECDVPVCEYSSTFDVYEDHSEILSDSNNDDILSDGDAFEDIEYVEATLPDSELVSLEEENDEDEFQDTVVFKFGQNRKNQYFGPLVDTGKFHEIPHSYHNKENLVTHVDINYHYSSDCNLVPVHRQTGTIVDNHNHHVNYFYINCTSNSRTEVVEDLKELAEYKESLENSSNKIATSNSNQEKEGPPQDSNIQLFCMHDNVNDLIESALNSKLLSINLNSQRLDKENQEVKNVVEQPTKRRTRIIESLRNFRVIHKKSSISLNNASQISLVHAIVPVLPTEKPRYSLSMGYEHLSTIPKTESDKVIESSVKNLVPIPSEYEVTFEDKNECDVPVCEDSSTFDVCEDHFEILFDSNNDDISSDDDAFEYIKYVEASLLDSKLVILEDESDVYQKDEEFNLEEIQNVILREKLLSINHLIANIKSLNDNPTLDRMLNSSASIPIFEESDNSLSISDNSSPEFETFSDHTEETRSGSTTTHANNSLPEYDSFCFEIEPDSKEVISAVINNINEINEDECFDPGGEINVFSNVEDDDYFLFIFFIRIFLPYLIYAEVSPLLLSAGSEDTIFDTGISV